mgnify:CR=1 FL=1
MRKANREKHCQWCIAMVPTIEWATLMFPELDKDEALDKLWNLLFKLCYLTEDNDIVEVWKQKNIIKHEQGKKLDDLHLKAFHYTASNGTDLIVELTPYSKFSYDTPKDALTYNANIPTEEVFTSPNKYGTRGVVYASRPLILGGKKVENFGFRFEKGKAVEWGAEKNADLLGKMLKRRKAVIVHPDSIHLQRCVRETYLEIIDFHTLMIANRLKRKFIQIEARVHLLHTESSDSRI